MTNFDKYMVTVDDGGAQKLYLKEFGSEYVKGGICLCLAITWLDLYLKDNNTLPNEIWHEMKKPTMLKQIANNQEAYMKNGYNVNEVLRFYQLYSHLGELDFSKESAIQVLNGCFNNSPLILIILDFEQGRHAISMIRRGERVFLYDPNFGVINAPDNNYQNLLTLVYHFYEIDKKMTITRMVAHGIMRV